MLEKQTEARITTSNTNLSCLEALAANDAISSVSTPMGTINPGVANDDRPAANDDGNFHRRVALACKKLSRLPNKIALRFARRLPSHVELDDLVGAGSLGLVAAVRQHIDKPDLDIKRLAEQRVRGAILDHLRSVDHLTRRQRAAVSAYNRMKQSLIQDGRPSEMGDVAKKLGITLDRAEHISNHLAVVHVTQMQDSEQFGQESDSPLEATVKRQLSDKLGKSVGCLSQRLQELLSLYYVESLTYKEIGQRLGISRSRICQLHTQAISELRQQMKEESVA